MNTATLTGLLRQQPFAEGLTEEEIALLAALGREERFGRDHVLFTEGEECRQFYLIVSGSVALEIVPPSGAFRVETLGAGDEFGWSSMLGRGMQFQARVLQDLHALVFDAGELRALCQSNAAFGYEFMSRLLGIVAERLQVTRLLLMDTRWPVAKLAGA